MDGPRGYCAGETARESEVPDACTYMWNLTTKTDEQAEQRQAHTYREHFDGGLRAWVKNMKGLRRANW